MNVEYRAIYLQSSLFDVGELLGEEGRREDLVDGDAARPGDFADVVGEVALVTAGVGQLRLRDFQADLRKSRKKFHQGNNKHSVYRTL